MTGKPFIKWAGGKSQLLADIQKNYPSGFGKSVNRYCEPFVGGGAVLFDVLSNYDVNEVLINDINEELINTYRKIKETPNDLISSLMSIQDEFWPLDTSGRKEFFYIKQNIDF